MSSNHSQCSWMAGIDDRTLLSKITLPGTHDTAALHGGSMVECQGRPLLQQLQIGIRLLDLRLCFVQTSQGENFALHHGNYYQWAYFDQNSDYSNNSDCREFILQDCIRFLRENPTECIVMSIKQDGSSADAGTFINLFNRILKNYSDFFYSKNAVPKLGDVRGKIVVVNRVTQDCDSIYWGDWDKQLIATEDPKDRNLDVEDHYSEVIFGNKWNYVNTHLSEALSVSVLTDNNTWFVTFASCAGGGYAPATWAGYMNPQLSLLFRNTTMPAGRYYGSILMDFPSPQLTTSVIEVAFEGAKASVPKAVRTITTPWLYDEYDPEIHVAHDYGQNNRIALSSPAKVKVVEVLYQDGYGIINFRVVDSAGKVIEPDYPNYDPNHGGGWVSGDFGGQSFQDGGTIDGIQFAYQNGYGLVNVRVHKQGIGFGNWLTGVDSSKFDFITDPFITGSGFCWIGTWRQDKYGLVDAQCCYKV